MSQTILQLSDLHFGRDAVDPETGLNASLRLQTVLRACAPIMDEVDLLLLTGDLTDDASPEGLDGLVAQLEPLGLAVVAVPGNHDDPEQIAARFAHNAFLGPWLVQGLDTTLAGETHGRFRPNIVDPSHETEHPYRLVALHHPPLTPTNNPLFQLDGAAEMLEWARAMSRPPYVASGHLHLAFTMRTAWGMQVLGCPSTFIGFDHSNDELRLFGSKTGARILELGRDGTLASRLIFA